MESANIELSIGDQSGVANFQPDVVTLLDGGASEASGDKPATPAERGHEALQAWGAELRRQVRPDFRGGGQVLSEPLSQHAQRVAAILARLDRFMVNDARDFYCRGLTLAQIAANRNVRASVARRWLDRVRAVVGASA